jgi:hypothetical protein
MDEVNIMSLFEMGQKEVRLFVIITRLNRICQLEIFIMRVKEAERFYTAKEMI